MQENSRAKETVNRRIMIDLQRRLALLKDDIKIAKKTRENLLNDNEKMQEELEQNAFQLEELRTEKPDQQLLPKRNENADADEKATFFGNLAELEAFEASTLAQIDQLKKQYSQCTHEYTKQVQRKKVLQSKLANMQERLELQRQQHSTAKSEHVVTQQENLRLSDQLFSINETKYYLEEELEKKQQELETYKNMLDNQIEGQKKPLLEEREILLKTLEDAQINLRKLQEQHEKNVAVEEVATKQVDNISNWIYKRKQLIDQIKKKRANISRNQATMKRAQIMNAEIKGKFIAMFGRSDPGDGTGSLAKLMVQSEIDSIEESNQIYQEIAAEEDYNQSLKNDLEQVINSLKVFEKYRQQQISDLTVEVENCKNEAYITMLKEEKAALIASARY